MIQIDSAALVIIVGLIVYAFIQWVDAKYKK